MAPPVAVYVVAAVVGVAAAFAFKEFVYEPHIAPKFEAWAEEFLERRRRARNRHASAVPVPVSRRRRGSASSSHSSHHDDDPHGDLEHIIVPGPSDFPMNDLELEALASKEVDEWRNEVLRSQERTRGSIRRRRTDQFKDGLDSFDSTTLDESSLPSLTQTPLAYVISNISSPVSTGTMSLPQTPTRRRQPEFPLTMAREDASVVLIDPPSPISPLREMPVVMPETPVSAHPTPRPADGAHHVDIVTPSPLAIPSTVHRSLVEGGAPHPLPFTPSYQIMANDSPFGPLLPDTPGSSAEIYGERPFSPITRVMGSSTSGSRHPSRANSMSSVRTLGSSGVLRKGSGLANEVVMDGSDDGSDEETHPLASTSTLTSQGPGVNGSVISSLSERYPAPPTPPVMISPPASSVGVLSAPSTPRSGGSDIVMHEAARPSSHVHPSLTLLQVPTDPSSQGQMARSQSQGHSATSSAFSYASFLSPNPVSRAASESEGDEFMSVASEGSEWNASPVIPGGQGPSGPVPDRAHNPFLDFEDLARGAGGGSENGDGSEVGSDGSWASARRH